mmetsp:Transcript_19414/g.35180  ORF Transcript_19414/g.35180 Transcript_19414/m.35180 type:complete len:81 (-) Transcript_19414:145-387(-)
MWSLSFSRATNGRKWRPEFFRKSLELDLIETVLRLPNIGVAVAETHAFDATKMVQDNLFARPIEPAVAFCYSRNLESLEH